MAIRLCVLLDTPATLSEVVDGLGALIGRPLARRDLAVGVVYTEVMLGIQLRLFGDHGLVDDCGISFTRFQYQLDLVPLDSGVSVRGFDDMYRAVALFLGAAMVSERGSSVVVANLQRQVASFGV